MISGAGLRALKRDRLLLVTDEQGNVDETHRGPGLYLGDTRVLSRYLLEVPGVALDLLAHDAADGSESKVLLASREPAAMAEGIGGAVANPARTLAVLRERSLDGGLHERIRVQRFVLDEERCRLTLLVGADDADMFEVRGLVRQGRRPVTAARVGRESVTFASRGLDGVVRTTFVRATSSQGRVTVEEAPEGKAEASIVVEWALKPGAEAILDVSVTATAEPAEGLSSRRRARTRGADDGNDRAARGPSVVTGNAALDAVFRRAREDLATLRTIDARTGREFLAAGIPWYCCLFGRDSIITALQLLPFDPAVAADTLRILAAWQACEVDETRDAEPGKILHELRTGELARSGAIPFDPYYGSVDATPLWLVLLGAYERWTADQELVEELWPHALRALEWLDFWGDRDADGFVQYLPRAAAGLVNHGWKDSYDANRHRDGSLAHPPLALVEVQAYAYLARCEVARLALSRRSLAEGGALALEQEAAAERLQLAFERSFWMEDAGTYAVALDTGGRQVRSVTSNPGHVLWTGIASPDHAARVASSLRGADMWSGWGVRTLSSSNPGYNPMGYHVGTVWPHDTAIAAAGLARYGHRDVAAEIADGLLAAAAHSPETRLPEVLCGFDRTGWSGPVPYPDACSPQAWAAGAPFHLVETMLGLRGDAAARTLHLAPRLPASIPHLGVTGLRVGGASVDVAVTRDDRGESVTEVLQVRGDVTVRAS